jgi:transketolase
MRSALSDVLISLGKRDSSILLITGDHGYALFDDFRRECPTQYINAGIAEQNMVGLAAGLARAGFRPIVYGLSAFVPIRVLEHIKLDVAHDHLPVIFIGDGAGFVYSHLGTSHQSTEDIACSRVIPNLSVYSPADRFELTQCLNIAYQEKSAVYLRAGKADRGDVHQSELKIKLGELVKVRESKNSKYSFIATGSMVRTAIDVADELPENIDVWSVPFIKPINRATVEKICQKSKAIIVLEEHSKYGGLGSLISEISVASNPVKILQIAVNDRFSEKCGTYDYLLQEHGLNFEAVHKKVSKFLLDI